ncbi:putative lipid II flippase FtsW [Curtobacterium ammoniigenes]|uniref:putative lipid II flippase FtsW n=1 Tax=Curtobacterium ammoniigenes TaxID=395387 RepID=UPI0009FAFD96|nr:putative lipid II flippase FtsW [Curtobacterium ammoniigenes]
MANQLARLRQRIDAVSIAPARRGSAIVVRDLFRAPSSTYALILGVTLFLVVFGVTMVLSSSSVEQYRATGDAFGAFLRQGAYAMIGVPAMLLASRVPARLWRRWAGRIVLGGLLVQAAVVLTPLGYSIQGNRNWIRIGSFTAQPSELLKLALCLAVGTILCTRRRRLDDWRGALLPAAVVAAAAIGLVLAGKDLGTALIMMTLVFGALFVGGVRVRHLAVAVAVLASLLPVAVLTSGSRSGRIAAWLRGCPGGGPDQDLCWQPVHGQWALAHGGVFGVGLGNSKMKWSWLPEADNDFIFAIVGEELGLIGGVVVLGMFVLLTGGMMQVVRRTTDPFARATTGGVLTWIVVQALVNVAVVLGLLPVLGVPLPLISAGGSALITSLVAIGVVLSFARDLPASVDSSSQPHSGEPR